MITLTPGAAQQIRRAADEAEGPAILRVAARRAAGGEIDYGLGFDEWRTGDLRVVCEGVFVVVAPQSRELLEGVTIDYVELEPGQFRFIFSAPSQEASAPLEQP